MNYFSDFSKVYAFEKTVGKILSGHYKLKEQPFNRQTDTYDFETANGVPIEIKYSLRNNFNRFLTLAKNFHGQNNGKLIFVTNTFFPQEIKEEYKLQNGPDLKIITLENLLYLCGDNEELKADLFSCIEFSTETATPLPLDGEIVELLKDAELNNPHALSSAPANFKDRLSGIPAGKNASGLYETFCADFVKTVFQNNIETPVVQKKNNKGLFRFDIVASLKSNPESFWKFIYDKFNSCFILFECKNHKEKIKQEQIYLTEKYLYNNALRNVAVILSRKGADKGAVGATYDILKEHGKLILILDDNDVLNLDKIYNDSTTNKNSVSASDYLMQKTKEFLLNLDK